MLGSILTPLVHTCFYSNQPCLLLSINILPLMKTILTTIMAMMTTTQFTNRCPSIETTMLSFINLPQNSMILSPSMTSTLTPILFTPDTNQISTWHLPLPTFSPKSNPRHLSITNGFSQPHFKYAAI